jgi:hypothetical protein
MVGIGDWSKNGQGAKEAKQSSRTILLGGLGDLGGSDLLRCIHTISVGFALGGQAPSRLRRFD